MNTPWEDLAATAVLGTGRHPEPVSLAGDATVAGLANQLQGPATRQLLGAAALLTQVQAAGAVPQVFNGSIPAASAAEHKSPCSAAIAAELARILVNNETGLLVETLEWLAQHEQLAPAWHCPQLLTLARQDIQLRPLVTAVLGERGRWLAAQNPDWQFALAHAADDVIPADAEQLWHTGSVAERTGLLKQLRSQQPALARDWIAATWKEDRAETRAAFISCLKAGLSCDDEPLLEGALDDRSQDVRNQALELLLSLPESALRRRMQEHAASLLNLKTGLFGARLEVTLPAAYDPVWKRDGISREPPPERKDLGEHGWWLLQMLGCVAPVWWCEKWNIAPARLDKLADGDWRELLLEAWFSAARRHDERDYLALQLPRLLAVPDRPGLPEQIALCLRALPVEEAEHRVAEALRRECGKANWKSSAGRLLTALASAYGPRLWAASLQQAYLDHAIAAFANFDKDAVALITISASVNLRYLADATNARLLDALTALNPPVGEDPKALWAERQRQHFIHQLERRAELLRALATPDPPGASP